MTIDVDIDDDIQVIPSVADQTCSETIWRSRCKIDQNCNHFNNPEVLKGSIKRTWVDHRTVDSFILFLSAQLSHRWASKPKCFIPTWTSTLGSPGLQGPWKVMWLSGDQISRGFVWTSWKPIGVLLGPCSVLEDQRRNGAGKLWPVKSQVRLQSSGVIIVLASERVLARLQDWRLKVGIKTSWPLGKIDHYSTL